MIFHGDSDRTSFDPKYHTGCDVSDGDSIEATFLGLTFIAFIHREEDHEPPWSNSDMHGAVREVTGWGMSSNLKRPGERVLWTDRNSALLYDWQGAVKRARKERWGTAEGRLPGEKARTYHTRAAEADFAYLKAWANDEWFYVGVDVMVRVGDIILVDNYEHALWGIENTDGEYLTEVANELADEAYLTAKERMPSLLQAVFGCETNT